MTKVMLREVIKLQHDAPEAHSLTALMLSGSIDNNILGEDRLSKFKYAFPIEMYFENIDNFEGGGYILQ